MATIRDVSQLAQVSQATVSRVLNGGVAVSAQKRAAVLAAIEQLAYSPNAFARSLATNRSGALGALVSELSSHVYGDIIRGIESVAEEHGMHLVVSSGHAHAENERRSFDFLKQRRTDALILQIDATTDAALAEWSSSAEIPVVFVGHYIAALAERCVYLDNVMGGELATRHLLERGHRRIAHVAGLMRIPDAVDRLQGYRTALAAYGVPFDETLIANGDFVEDGGERAMRRLLERGGDFSAVFVANDQSAAGALKALRDAGKRVPDDVSLIGFDDTMVAHYLYPALTTVRQPFYEMGQAAAWIALTSLGMAERKEVMRRFEPVLIERDSVAAR